MNHKSTWPDADATVAGPPWEAKAAHLYVQPGLLTDRHDTLWRAVRLDELQGQARGQ